MNSIEGLTQQIQELTDLAATQVATIDKLTREKKAAEARAFAMADLHVVGAAAQAAVPVAATGPTVKQLTAQLGGNEKWTIAEQQAFAPFLAQFPNECSQGILSLGSAWKHGIAYAQSLAAPQQHAQAALSDEREAFEKFYRDRNPRIAAWRQTDNLGRNSDGDYFIHPIPALWEAWQARAILATRQPAPVAAAVQGDDVTPREMAIAQAIRQECSRCYKSSCTAFSEALGDIDLAAAIRALNK